MSISDTNNYACHRLIDEHGRIFGSTIVSLDKENGNVLYHHPFNYEEVPFVQWLGGIIVLKGNPLRAWHRASLNQSEGELYCLG